jgi:superfamily II DNA/RNA helicase
MAQVAREKALTKFREGKLRVLVATDVAARGIDVKDISHVINYSCPEDDKAYVHRIGRTGRAGASGIAITFVDWADLHRWKMINKALDLPFEDPQETYSTSEHLFHDQGIAPGTKGRLVDAPPVERKPREDRDGSRGKRDGSRGGSRDGAREGSREGGQRNRNRNRTRTRSGEQVKADGEQPKAEGADGTPSRSRSRNRRRRSGAERAAASE